MQYFPWIGIGLLSVLVGSFCTVLVYRLPLILQQRWRESCQLSFSEEQGNNLCKTFSIASPFSIAQIANSN